MKPIVGRGASFYNEIAERFGAEAAARLIAARLTSEGLPWVELALTRADIAALKARRAVIRRRLAEIADKQSRWN